MAWRLVCFAAAVALAVAQVPAIDVGPGMRENPEGWFATNVKDQFVFPFAEKLDEAVSAMDNPFGFAAVNYDSVAEPMLKGLGLSVRSLYLGPCVMRSPFVTPSGGVLYVTSGSNITFGFVANNTQYQRSGIKTGDLVDLFPGTVGYAANFNCEPFVAISVYAGDGTGPIFPLLKYFPGFPTQLAGAPALDEAKQAFGDGATTVLGECLAACGQPIPADTPDLNVYVPQEGP